MARLFATGMSGQVGENGKEEKKREKREKKREGKEGKRPHGRLVEHERTTAIELFLLL
jgi:hypothetical protein